MEIIANLQQISDAELLARLCSQSDDDLLYNEAVRRFLHDLELECQKICNRRKLHPHVGIQIAHECFEKLRKYKSFKVDGVKIQETPKALRAYLYRIAVNLFNDFQRHNDRKQVVVVNKTYFDDIFPTVGNSYSTEELHLMKQRTLGIFRMLTAREQKVLLLDIEHKRSQKYLPDDVVELLATEFGVKKDTIRKIRERAINKLKKAIHENSEN